MSQRRNEHPHAHFKLIFIQKCVRWRHRTREAAGRAKDGSGIEGNYWIFKSSLCVVSLRKPKISIRDSLSLEDDSCNRRSSREREICGITWKSIDVRWGAAWFYSFRGRGKSRTLLCHFDTENERKKDIIRVDVKRNNESRVFPAVGNPPAPTNVWRKQPRCLSGVFWVRTIKTYSGGASGRQKRNKNNWIHFIIYRREKNLSLTATQKCCETLFFRAVFTFTFHGTFSSLPFCCGWKQRNYSDAAFRE